MDDMGEALIRRIAETLISGTGNDLDDMCEYVRDNPHAAQETYRHQGTLFDMDCLVDMSVVLERPVDWAEYAYVNGRISEDVLSYCEDRETARTEIEAMLRDFAVRPTR